MAPSSYHALVNVTSATVYSHNEASILVEAGGFAPMRWFVERGLRSSQHDGDDAPPSKKRKTDNDCATGDAAEHFLQADPAEFEANIPLSQMSIDLHFSNSLISGAADREKVERDVEFDETESIHVIPVIVNLFDSGQRLKLASAHKNGPVVAIDVGEIPEKALKLIHRHCKLPNIMRENDVRSANHPACVTRCTLTRSRGKRFDVVRLNATICWRSGVSAFPAGAPVGAAKVYDDYEILLGAFPDLKREKTDHTQEWAPHDFYDSVHVPSKEMDVQEDFCDVLESELYPFQKRAVHWMLEREGMKYTGGHLERMRGNEWAQKSPYLEPVRDLHGSTCYVNHFQGIVQRWEDDHPGEKAYSRLSGGLLAEEMGLGKTVELMALMRVHSRPQPMRATVFDADSDVDIVPSKATLIITPNSILQQWQAELENHAPALRVLTYEGVAAKQEAAKRQSLENLTSEYDVVLATYQTLAKEIHFAEKPPDRKMRHAPKHERKRSPLVRIQWWRVCLDEAQMVESGVTNAARVARRLPRVHSWAVSGTPLRKNVLDLHGLLIFLRYKPLSEDSKLWLHLITNHKHLFRTVFGQIALRHTKAVIREDLNLPPQKRVVINVSFSNMEQKHYSTMFEEMCEAVGVNQDGSPKRDDWDPDDSATSEAMRTFLNRLRQTCLHPQVGGKNRKALGGGGGMRDIAEVLEMMIEQRETSLKTEERTLLAIRLQKAHIVGNARDDTHRSVKALAVYLEAINTSRKFVQDARERLASAKAEYAAHEGGNPGITDDEDSSAESTPVLGRLRNNLRTCLLQQHACTFFAATSFFQIKSNEDLTKPDSNEFKELEQKEVDLYEAAKLIRKEILKESSRKAESWMRKIKGLEKNGQLTKIPKIKDLESFGGIESRRIVEKSNMLFDIIREQAKVIIAWRTKMAEYLLKPLVDDDKGVETTGDEYEDSTKMQDELYAYFDACKYIHSDLNTAVTGEGAPLIDHEAKMLGRNAKNMLDPTVHVDVKVQVHAPQLCLDLLAVRNTLRTQQKDTGSIRGLIQEARGLETTLQGHEAGGRAAERMLVRQQMSSLQNVFAAYTKALEGLEKEIESFRNAQNQRLEFYRQLQEVSDIVRPYKEDLDDTLDEKSLKAVMEREETQVKSLDKLKADHRHYVNCRDDRERVCIICTCNIEIGILTSCAHRFCKDCLEHWMTIKQSCPTCKRPLERKSLHRIVYKTQELRMQEEVQSGTTSPTESSTSTSSPAQLQTSSIYSGIDNEQLKEIQSIELPISYGTKIDTIGRHLRWLRSHDPGAKSVIFSQYREFLDVLAAALRDFKIGHTRLGRPGAVEKFKHDPSIDCLLLDAKTDSSGLTLVNATHVILCEPLIQTAVELQAIARVHRIGQTRPTTVWMYLVNDTVEESIYEISVARRLAHVQSRQQQEASLGKSKRALKSRSATPAPNAQAQENAIEMANSEEMQSAPMSKLLVAGKGGGEVVGNADLWQCLFGKAPKKDAMELDPDVEMAVGRHLRAGAAEGRVTASSAAAVGDGGLATAAGASRS